MHAGIHAEGAAGMLSMLGVRPHAMRCGSHVAQASWVLTTMTRPSLVITVTVPVSITRVFLSDR